MKNNESVMPVLFIGHGTPMNAIENNEFSEKWRELGQVLFRPEAILCVSAHWEVGSSLVTAVDKPETIHDFGGFPEELYAQQYPALGSSSLVETIQKTVKQFEIEKAYEWGLDHGAWCFLKHMYPEADIPVVQLSIDYTKEMRYHYDLGKELAFLRRMGVLIVGSGNMVHNLMLARPGKNGINTQYAYSWAGELNDVMKAKILMHDHVSMINYHTLNQNAKTGIPTEEHYIPLIYTLALQEAGEPVEIFNDKIVAGSVSMTSLIIGDYINNANQRAEEN